MDYEKEYLLAIEIVKEVGKYLSSNFTKEKIVLSEDGKDIKLFADKEAEKFIINSLSRMSTYPILSEESGEIGDIQSEAPYWIIDPLDGTANYKKNIPICCISIAMWEDNEPIFGVIYDFIYDNLYTGIIGKGATFNKTPIIVSKVRKKSQAILATGFPVSRDYSKGSLLKFLKTIQDFKKIRMIGSAALSLALIASGRLDSYYEEDIMIWDVAAGIAIVLAAGGIVKVNQSKKNKWARTVSAACNLSVLIESGDSSDSL